MDSSFVGNTYAIHESDNVVDRRAIPTRKRLPESAMKSTVRNLPNDYKIYHVIWSRSTVKVVDTHHHWLSLIHGELEIPTEVTVTMRYSEQNRVAMVKYEQLFNKHYKEPDQDGNFEDVAKKML